MNKEVISKEPSGTDLIRRALIARNSKLNLALFARDLGLNGDQVHAFIRGADLTPEQKRAVCNYLWAGNTQWDETSDKLRPAKLQEPKRFSSFLPELNPKLLRKYTAGPAGKGPQPAKELTQLP